MTSSEERNWQSGLLLNAAQEGNIVAAAEAIQRGADVNLPGGVERRSSPLTAAASHGHTEMVRFLIENRADVYQQTAFGHTALTLALYHGHLAAAQVLAEKWVDHGLSDNKNDWCDKLFPHVKGVHEFIEKYREDFGLHQIFNAAVMRRDLPLIKKMHLQGFPFDVPFQYGMTPLSIAISNYVSDDNEDVALYLLEQGARIDIIDDFGDTSFFDACENGACKTLAAMLDRGGMDLDQKNRHGFTPLLLSLFNLQSKTSVLLIERGADIYATCDDVPSIKERAIDRKMPDVVAAIEAVEEKNLAAAVEEQLTIREGAVIVQPIFVRKPRFNKL